MIPQAQRLSLEGLAAAIADLAERARAKRLEPDEVHGGTFTITNPGQFGAVLATPIINQPQVAILDLEAIVKRPVVVDGRGRRRLDRDPADDATCCMSWDHRALDGAEAARFLAAVKGRLEAGGESMAIAIGRAQRQAAAPPALASIARSRSTTRRSSSDAASARALLRVAVHSTALGPALGGAADLALPRPERRGRATRCGSPRAMTSRRPPRGSTSAAARA